MSFEGFGKNLLDGDHVLITGGSSGINFAIADRFARLGADLTLIARTQEDLDESADTLSSTYGAETLGLSADVRNMSRLETLMERSVDELGKIKCLVCGAAGNFPAAASEMSDNAFGSVVDIDLKGTFNACRAAYDYFQKPGGSIIAISAVQSEQPTPFQSHACAAKAGVDSLVENLALEWGSEGIRVNAIQPGPIDDTEGMRKLLPDSGAKNRLAETLPLGRLGEKSDVADLAHFLISPMADFITGAVIPVDGGQRLVGSGGLVESVT
ncbi:MAG: SDR family oxidoreductase [bacterium]